MGFYAEQILPRITSLTLGTKAMKPLRERAMEGLSGEVVELGFGSGTNVGLYPPEVTRVLAVEPSRVAQNLSAAKVAKSSVPVEMVGLDGTEIPLEGSSVDNVLTTWTLCTIPDLEAALGEVSRILRPGGHLFYLEHGLADDPKVARRQERWNGLQQRIAGGCHLTRPIDRILTDCGFDFERSAKFMIAGPKIMSFMYAGVATPAT